MPDAKISDLPDGGDPQDTDDFVVARGVTNNKIAWSSMSNAIASQQIAIEASNTTYTSGTVVLTGAGGGVTVGSAAGQQAVISVAAPVAQTVQTQNVVDVTLSGNTAGALALISSGTMTLAGGNNITLSQAGNAITISGPAAAGAQTAISGLANSETTYTSGTVLLSGLANVTVRSTTGQAFQFSVPSQSVQPETQTFVGGISASDTLYTSGSVRFSGSQAVTVRSGTGQLVIIDAPAQSVQPETQTFIAGISASDTLYTSGNVRFTGVGGGITVSTNTGQRVDLSVAAQSVQPETQTFLSGLGNSQTTYTSGVVNLSVEGGAMTIRSTTGQAFRFSVSQSVQAETQTAISGIANSQTTYTSGTVSLSELGAITIRSTTGNQYQFSVNSQTNQSAIRALGASNTGNTAGNTGVSTGIDWVLAGSNNITISQSTAGGGPNTLWVSGPTVGGAQTGISGIANSQTTYTSGTVSLSELGAITIRSTTGNQYQFSVNAQTTQTQGILSAGVSTGGNTLGNTTVNTGSRMVFVGSNNITLSQGTAAGATTITISGPATSAQQTGISGIGNSQTTYTSGTVNLSVVAGNLTIRSTTGNAFQFSASQSVQAETQTAISGIANSQTTYTSGTVSLSELGAITIRSTTGNQYQFSVNSQTVQTQNLVVLYDGANSISSGTARFTNANGVSFSFNGQTVSGSVNESMSMFAVSNTTQSSSGTAHKSALSFAGAGGVSVGVTGGTVVVSGGAGGAGLSAGLSNIGNTSGDTASVTGRLIFAGGNNITLSGSTNGGSMTITVSAPNLGAGAMSAGVSTGGNTAGATGITGTQLVLVGSGPISLSQTTGANGGTVSINAPATSSLSATGLVSISTNGSTISIGVPAHTTHSSFDPDWTNRERRTLVVGQGSLAIRPMPVDRYFQHDRVVQLVQYSQATNSTLTVTVSAWFGLYTRNVSTLSLLSSTSGSMSINGSGTASSARNSGIRGLTFGWTNTVAPNDYYLGVISRTTTAGNNASISNMVYSQQASTWSGIMGESLTQTAQITLGQGHYTATTSALPASIGFTQINGNSSLYLHPPIVYFQSQTV